jgi:predicted lactoylglutathione lyase
LQDIKEIYEEMGILINNMEDEDAVQEVKEGYEVFDKNTKILLEAHNLDDFLEKYEALCKSENGVLECFDLSNADDLKVYIEQNNIDFDELKLVTAQTSYAVLENLVYEAEEEY